jgi:hypothetical protein
MSLADRLVLSPEFKVRTSRSIALDHAVAKIEAAFPGVDKRPVEDVAVILAKVEAALRARDWSSITSGEVSVAVFTYIEGDVVLSTDLQEFIDRETKATTNPTLLDAMCRGYLTGWTVGSNKTKTLAALLMAKANLLPSRWKNLFSRCPDFLDADNGCAGVGARMVETISPFSWLKDIGLLSPHDKGFMRQAHVEFLRKTPDAKVERVVDKLIAWVSPLGQPELLDTRAAEVVEKILSPWVVTECPEGLREHCVDRLLKRFGDPRKEHQGFWAQIGEKHRRVMLKWLARKSMEAIFEIVTDAERGTDQGHQWANRKRFWLGVYDKGRIDEAWVALGSSAIPYAKSLFSRTGDPSFLSYGRQTGRNDTCLLFMKLGNKTIVEGSHSFRVHVFPTASRATPVLYANNYDLDDILLPNPHDDARMHDTGGNWMRWVQRRIS